jgi:hypothetical protein
LTARRERVAREIGTETSAALKRRKPSERHL